MYDGSNTMEVYLYLKSSPKWTLLTGGGFPPNDDSGTQIHCLVVLSSSTIVSKFAVFIYKELWKKEERVGKAHPFLNCWCLKMVHIRMSHMTPPRREAGKCSSGSWLLPTNTLYYRSGSMTLWWTINFSAIYLSCEETTVTPEEEKQLEAMV